MSSPDQNRSEVFNGTAWFISHCTISLDADSRRIALFLLYLFIFVAGLLENLLVVWVNWRRRHSANGVLFCVINVSLSDLMVVAVLPFFMMEVTLDQVWLWGRFLCKVTNLIYFVNFYSSSFFLSLMTLERYLSLTRPASPAIFPAGARRRWVLCGGLWAFSLFLALVENVHVDIMEWDEPGCYVMPDHNVSEWYVSVAFLCLVFQFLGPGVLILTCNVLIARAVRTAPEVRGRRDVWLVHVYSLVFLVCWLPYHAVAFLMILEELDPNLYSCNMAEGLFFSFSVVQSMSLFHCVANPVLYSFLSKSFRDNLVNAVLSRIPREAAEDRDKGGAPAGEDQEKQRSGTSQSDISS